MFRFTIRDLLWLTIVVALGVSLIRERFQDEIATVALEGFCPVSVVESQKWYLGDPRFVAIYQGRRHLFVSATKRETFLAAPERYSPVCAGNDVVRLTDTQQESAGSRHHGLIHDARLYLFDSEEAIERFSANPARYVKHR